MLYILTRDANGDKVYLPWIPSYRVCDNHNDLQGVYRPEPIEKVERELNERIDRFNEANSVGNIVDKQRYFRGDHFIKPLLGAFGEKL